MLTREHIRSGTYISFKSELVGEFVVGERGTTLMPLITEWGKDSELIEINVNDIVTGEYRKKIGDIDTLPLELALYGCKKVLIYKMNKGEKAKTKIGESLDVVARYSGEYGNNIAVGIKNNIVITQVDDLTVDEQEIENYNELLDNDWVTFSGEGEPSDSAFIQLSGGTNGNKSEQYDDFFKKAQEEKWDVLSCIDKKMNENAKKFIKYLRDTEEVKVQAVMVDDSANYEGIIKLKNQTLILNGNEVSAELLTAYVSGMSAGIGLKESLTNHTTPFTKILKPLQNSEIEKGIKEGFFLFTNDDEGGVKCEKDINSLIITTATKGKEFRKNQTIRIIDTIHRDIKRVSNKNYIGKIGNSQNDRMTLKSALVGYFDNLQANGVVEDFSATDLNVIKGEEIDDVKIMLRIKPVLNIDKIEMEVIL